MSEPTMCDVADRRVLLVDGTFVPTGNRPGQGRDVEKANYSGKHHVQCLNIQVACWTDGTLATVSEPVAGSRHDGAALRLAGWDQQLTDTTWIADTGYVGTNAITPRKKPRGANGSASRLGHAIHLVLAQTRRTSRSDRQHRHPVHLLTGNSTTLAAHDQEREQFQCRRRWRAASWPAGPRPGGLWPAPSRAACRSPMSPYSITSGA